MKWKSPVGGPASVANKGVAGEHFWKCGNDWTYGRFLGSVANTGLMEEAGTGRRESRRHTPLRCTGKSAEVIEGKGVVSGPLTTKSAEAYERKGVRGRGTRRVEK